MTTPVADEGTVVHSCVCAVVERIFDTVAVLHAAALACHEASRDVPVPRIAQPFAPIEAPVSTLLRAPGQLAVGLGMIVAPRTARTRRPQLQWWQADPSTDTLVQLDPDLRPSSLGFYDYTTAEWFDVPRRTRQRHVSGPFVDVHGTGRYVLTLTVPVVADGQFLGIVGAKVAVNRFESHLLREIGPQADAFVVVNTEQRVVLSTSPRWVTGCLFAPRGEARAGEPLCGVPWRLHLVAAPRTLALAASHPATDTVRSTLTQRRKERP